MRIEEAMRLAKQVKHCVMFSRFLNNLIISIDYGRIIKTKGDNLFNCDWRVEETPFGLETAIKFSFLHRVKIPNTDFFIKNGIKYSGSTRVNCDFSADDYLSKEWDFI